MTRKDAVQIITDLIKKNPFLHKWEEIYKALNMAIEALQDDWTPMSDDTLPKKNGRYFVTVKRGYVTTAIWVGNAEFWNEVIAWMPSPEPYKGDDTEWT